jgi:hypothetical protein
MLNPTEVRQQVRDLAMVLAREDYLDRYPRQLDAAAVWAVRSWALFAAQAVELLALMLAADKGEEKKGPPASASPTGPMGIGSPARGGESLS